MKKCFLLTAVFCAVVMSGCGIRIGEKTYLRYTVKAQTPIYYSYNDDRWEILPEGGEAEFRKGGMLRLSRSADEKDIFYTVELGHMVFWGGLLGDDYVAQPFATPRDSFAGYYFSSLISVLVNNGWRYSVDEESGLTVYRLTLTVDEEMSLQPRLDVSELPYRDFLSSVGGFTMQKCALIYMIADNDLYSYAVEDINKMERAYRGLGDIYVYFDGAAGTPYSEAVLLKICHDETPEIVSPVIKLYGEVDSCNWDQFWEVWNDETWWKQSSAPKMVVFWGHGNGWLPQWLTSEDLPLNLSPSATRSIGPDETSMTQLDTTRISISSLAVFDACRMSSVEMHTFSNFIAPSTDIEPGSYPYDDTEFLEALVLGDGQTIVDKIVESNARNGREISVTWKKPLPEDIQESHLAGVFGDFLKKKSETGKIDLSAIRSKVKMYYQPQEGNVGLYYDFYDFVKQLNGGVDEASVRAYLDGHYYVRSTDTILGGQSPAGYSGLTCYIPYHTGETDNVDVLNLNRDYLRTDWAEISRISDYVNPIALPPGGF